MKFVHFFAVLALLTALVAIALKLALDYEHIPNLVSIESVARKRFDYVIIGAGTAGAVVAYELSKSSNYSVLLIEAGGIFGGLSIVPLTSTLMQGTDVDWRLKSTPQLFSSRGLRNAQQLLPRGRGLGGSSQLNYLLHFSGIREDFDDDWPASWSYERLECHLKRHETHTRACSHDDSPRLSITPLEHDASPLTEAFVRAQSELRRTELDANVTLRLSQFTTRRGVRHTVFHEYLRRAFRHRNLSILVHATIERIRFDARKEAVAVDVTTRSGVTRIGVRNEVILAAGAYHSPLILQRSGVGDEAALKSAGIDLVHHAPAVGANLHDHMNMPLFVSINVSASVTKDKILSAREILRYLVGGAGVMATTGVIGSGRSGEHGLILFGMGSADENALRDVANFKPDAFRAFFPLHANSSQEGFVALSTCYKPRSRGSVSVSAGNDFRIDPRYLEDARDVECMQGAIRLNMRMIESRAFQTIGARIHWPMVRECRNFGPFDGEDFAPSDRYLECLLRHAALTAHHPGGTCALGTVVDDDLRVIGVRRLRVIDASILPAPVSGYPNSVIVAVAEQAVRSILN